MILFLNPNTSRLGEGMNGLQKNLPEGILCSLLRSSSFKTERLLLFFCLLFLPTQLGKHFWPPFSFIYSLPIDYFSPTVYFWDLLVLGLTFIWVVTWKTHKRINGFALNIFLIFFLTQLLSLINTTNLEIGLVRIEQYSVIGLFGVYLSSQELSKIKNLIGGALFLAFIFESLLAVSQFILNRTVGFWIFGERSFNLSTPAIAKFDFQGHVFLRPYGTFSHPNVLAGFMLLSLIFLIFLQRKYLHQIIFLLTAFVIVLSFSRTAFLGLIAQSFFLMRYGRILIIIFFVLISPFIFTRFSSLLNFDNLTLTRRTDLIKIAIINFKNFPFLGVGTNNFINQVANSSVSGPSRFLQPVHNILFLILAENGVVGLVGFLIFIGIPIWITYIRRKEQFYKTLLLCWITIFFLGMFDHYFLTLPQGQRLLFLIWGLSLIEN